MIVRAEVTGKYIKNANKFSPTSASEALFPKKKKKKIEFEDSSSARALDQTTTCT